MRRGAAAVALLKTTALFRATYGMKRRLVVCHRAVAIKVCMIDNIF